MIVKAGQLLAGIGFGIASATGAGAAADSLPTGTLWVNGVQSSAVVTVSAAGATGGYQWSATVPSNAPANAMVEVRIVAVIGGVTTPPFVVWVGQVDPLHRADVVHWDGEDVPVVPAAEDIAASTWGYSLASIATFATTSVGRWLYDAVAAILAAVGKINAIKLPYYPPPPAGKLVICRGETRDASNPLRFRITGTPPSIPSGGSVNLKVASSDDHGTALMSVEGEIEDVGGVDYFTFTYTAADTANLPECGGIYVQIQILDSSGNGWPYVSIDGRAEPLIAG